MVVTRYMGGKEITQADLRNIVITRNEDIRAILDRVVSRINRDAEENAIPTDDIPNKK